MARTRVKLRRPYKLQTTLDLGELVLVARYDASREKACIASLPQAPYDSATRGIHVIWIMKLKSRYVLYYYYIVDVIFLGGRGRLTNY